MDKHPGEKLLDDVGTFADVVTEILTTSANPLSSQATKKILQANRSIQSSIGELRELSANPFDGDDQEEFEGLSDEERGQLAAMSASFKAGAVHTDRVMTAPRRARSGAKASAAPPAEDPPPPPPAAEEPPPPPPPPPSEDPPPPPPAD